MNTMFDTLSERAEQAGLEHGLALRSTGSVWIGEGLPVRLLIDAYDALGLDLMLDLPDGLEELLEASFARGVQSTF